MTEDIAQRKKESIGVLKSYYSKQPGRFLEQLLVAPDLGLRIPNCIYDPNQYRFIVVYTRRFAPRVASAARYARSQGRI